MISETVATQSETSSAPWWLILIEGLAAIIVGILLLANPGSTWAVLVRLLGIYFFITGILSIIVIFIDNTAWARKLFAGIIGILSGFVIIEYPLWSTLLVPTTFVLVIAVFAIIIGLINIIHGIQGAGWGKGILGVISSSLILEWINHFDLYRVKGAGSEYADLQKLLESILSPNLLSEILSI